MKSPPFANFVLAQTDPDAFMVPLLKTLLQGVEAPQPNYPRFYLWLGILAQLTADSAFNAELHRQVLENQPWMADRSFRTITLSQLTVLVVIRIIQANFATHKDAFIHQCSLAILINFSAHMAHLPASLVQRLMKIFDMVARRYLKITAVWQDSASPNHQQLSNALHAADFHLYLDMLQVFIFVFSNTLHHHLRQNAHLIYSLLQSKEVFSTLQSDPQVGDAVNNINFVIAYFQACIGEAKLTSPSTEEVLQVIEDKSPLFRTAELPLTPWRAGFRVAAPNLEFYTPYIWQLIVKHSPLSYSLEEAVLVNAFDNEIG
ncbi:Dymeclin [Dimargaris cristalligena]|uniref:Dymeclin n=1 Tax=Dimargaris cristalligena TaxID=215637 RepID=A0A4P9ZVW4_9FUNG|nr:Dymeclin [Dimargaris cristalligena]|eukprot:RKP36992.1 Dymeclin [Dimargaris cristalligena]